MIRALNRLILSCEIFALSWSGLFISHLVNKLILSEGLTLVFRSDSNAGILSLLQVNSNMPLFFPRGLLVHSFIQPLRCCCCCCKLRPGLDLALYCWWGLWSSQGQTLWAWAQREGAGRGRWCHRMPGNLSLRVYVNVCIWPSARFNLQKKHS